MSQLGARSFARAFVRLSRPTFLAGGAVGVGLGTALAAHASGGAVDWRGWVAAQFMVTALQLMTHYSNEFYDRDADVHAKRTPFSGGSGVLAEGLFAPSTALAAALVALGCGLAAIGVLATMGHVLAASLGVATAVLAWTYSSPPLRWLSRGLGELDTALIVGVLVPLSAVAAQGLPFTLAALAATLPGAIALFVMMLAVEVPDVAADALAGKRNLVVRVKRLPIGEFTPVATLAPVVSLASLAIVLVYIALAAAMVTGAPMAVGWLELLTIPAGFGLIRLFRNAAGAEPSLGADASRLAGWGVAFFFLVSFLELLGFLVPL